MTQQKYLLKNKNCGLSTKTHLINSRNIYLRTFCPIYLWKTNWVWHFWYIISTTHLVLPAPLSKYTKHAPTYITAFLCKQKYFIAFFASVCVCCSLCMRNTAGDDDDAAGEGRSIETFNNVRVCISFLHNCAPCRRRCRLPTLRIRARGRFFYFIGRHGS